jgi:hypothetical protein
MSQIELYQSVLAKLGQLPVQELAALDRYLSQRLKNQGAKRPKSERSNILKTAGAWKDWDDREFEDFLNIGRQTRNEMFSDRNMEL